ncbi:Ribulose-5-phosphate 4-epimerase and related epimerases and aldolases [Bordetella hinzii]|nr:Ankyrin repeat protein [Bordetella hinzii]KCB31893.1 ankyrin repeat protein [Bordetella hinzii L60]SNV81786.1 Ribulose-5-phosphate 4-epimerase and related epimerases and aldolases [Bordetella hinzii]
MRARIKMAAVAAQALMALSLAGPPAAGAAEVPKNWWFYVHNDRPAELKALLARGADPNVRFKNGQPAIMRAVVDNAWEVFDVLAADRRTDVNIQNPAGETPLMYLALAGQTERARKLIARGAEVNRLGWTPLHYAASKGQVDTAKLLLSQGAMVNAPSSEGRTPLMMAGYSGNRAMVQLLLDAGADPTTQDLKGQTAADWALAGKWGSLSQELQRVSEAAWQAREAQRGGSAAGAAAAEPPRTPAEPAPAPAPAVRGVSGLRLDSYD